MKASELNELLITEGCNEADFSVFFKVMMHFILIRKAMNG